VLFYDHNILHRATYPISPKRGKRSENGWELTGVRFSDVAWMHVVGHTCWTREGSSDLAA
jgi:hypothetical protein